MPPDEDLRRDVGVMTVRMAEERRRDRERLAEIERRLASLEAAGAAPEEGEQGNGE